MKHGYWVYSLLIGCMESCYDLMTKFRAHNPKPTNMVNEFVSEVKRNFLWMSREEMAEKDWFVQERLATPISRRKSYFNSVGKYTSRYVRKFKRSLCHWLFILASRSQTEALKSCLKSFYASAIKQVGTFYKKRKKKTTWVAMDAFFACILNADRLISTWKRFSLDYFRLCKALWTFRMSTFLLKDIENYTALIILYSSTGMKL